MATWRTACLKFASLSSPPLLSPPLVPAGFQDSAQKVWKENVVLSEVIYTTLSPYDTSPDPHPTVIVPAGLFSVLKPFTLKTVRK